MAKEFGRRMRYAVPLQPGFPFLGS